jgi:hypothetical protein
LTELPPSQDRGHVTSFPSTAPRAGPRGQSGHACRNGTGLW